MWAGTGLVGAMCTRHDLNHEAPRNKAGGGTKHGNVLMEGMQFDVPISHVGCCHVGCHLCSLILCWIVCSWKQGYLV